MAYFANNITPQLAEGSWDAAVQTQIYLQYAQELEKRRGWSMVARKRIDYTGGTGTKLPVAEDMALAITALPRQADPAAATVSDSEITITAEEYGNWITWMHSAEREKSVNVRDYNATRVVNNALDSIDALYGLAAVGGSSVLLANNAANPAALAQGDVITANTFSLARAHMANNRARRIDGNMYGCIMHPSQVLDLFDNADNAKSLTEIMKHTSADPFIQGTIGKFMGIAIMELDSCLTVGRLAAGAGAGAENIGQVGGALGGETGKLVGEIGGAVLGDILTHKVVDFGKNIGLTTAEAQKQVIDAVAADLAANPELRTRLKTAVDNKEPIYLADFLQGTAARNLIGKNFSPSQQEAMLKINRELEKRAAGVQDAVDDKFKLVVGRNLRDTDFATAIEEANNATREKLYKDLKALPNAQAVTTQQLQALSNSNGYVREAIEEVNKQFREGKIAPNWNVNPASPAGPGNLAYWDLVKREIDHTIRGAQKGEASGNIFAGNTTARHTLRRCVSLTLVVNVSNRRLLRATVQIVANFAGDIHRIIVVSQKLG